MAHRVPDDVVFVAHRFASALAEIADRLDNCRDAASFVAALQDQGRLWRDMLAVGHALGCRIPDAMAEFVAAATGHARAGVDDHEVEAMISINRRLAEELARIPPGRHGPRAISLWSEWMSRQVDAITWSQAGEGAIPQSGIAYPAE
ncbi:MAG: hypothetical protein AB1918_05940 [Pseudomonadota bacterium]